MTATSVRTRRDARGVTRGFRPDIQALRALAVMSVMLYHLWPNRLTGGFVGVDIFFVISGYLITSHLIRERARTGRIALGKFWARRAARLLPASLLVLALVGVATLIWVPNALWPQFFGDVTASALYVQNWHLLFASVDYLAADNLASPVQHFWTLSAEEQFYVMLPLLMVLSMWLFRKLPWRTVMLAAIAIATVASFIYSVMQVELAPSAAYFSTFTRAWEFGAGALLAFAPAITRARPGTVVAGVGVAMLLASVVVYTGQTPFPGVAALLPVIGTVLAIWGGAPSLLAPFGRVTPIAMLGRVSYAVYLWHWAFIVIVPYATGVPLTTLHKLLIAAVSIALAWLSTGYVEDRVRTSKKLLSGRRPRTIAIWSAAGMACVLAISIGSTTMLRASEQSTLEAQEQLVEEQPDCFGAQGIDPELAPCDNPELDDAPLVPALSEIERDNPSNGDCWAGPDVAELNICTFGDPNASRHVFAVGDSHSNTMQSAYKWMAEEYGWRIDVAGHAGCYWTEFEMRLGGDEQTAACTDWRAAVAEHVAQSSDLDAIVVANRAGEEDTTDEHINAMVAAWAKRPNPESVPIIALRDNPYFVDSPVACISEDPDTANARCARPASEVLLDDGKDRAVAQDPNAHVIDLSRFYCADDVCPVVAGNVVMYRDAQHLTDTYVTTLAPYFGEEMRAVLGD